MEGKVRPGRALVATGLRLGLALALALRLRLGPGPFGLFGLTPGGIGSALNGVTDEDDDDDASSAAPGARLGGGVLLFELTLALAEGGRAWCRGRGRGL